MELGIRVGVAGETVMIQIDHGGVDKDGNPVQTDLCFDADGARTLAATLSQAAMIAETYVANLPKEGEPYQRTAERELERNPPNNP